MVAVVTNQDYVSVKHRPPMCVWLRSYDLDPVTLILNLDLDILNMYLCTKNEVCRFRYSKV